MKLSEFQMWCEAALRADPIRDLAVTLIECGVTERELLGYLDASPALPAPFKNKLHNTFRDHLTIGGS